MDIKPIRTETDYKEALKYIETLMYTRKNTPEGYLLDCLVTMVEAYEDKHYPFDTLDSVSSMKFKFGHN